MPKLKFIVLLSLLVIYACKTEDKPIDQKAEIVTDVDGNEYNTIQMGNQVWMVENLKTTKYNDGTAIEEYTRDEDWHNGNEKKAFYQWANTNDLNNVIDEELPFDYYGAQYNHFAIETGKLAPLGWRIPTVQDFKTLEAFIASDGNNGREASVLKTTSGWLPSSGNGTDGYGFKALPNGYVSAFGTSTFTEGICTWATSNVDLTNGTRSVINLYDQDTILYLDNAIQLGAGIRCIKE